MYLRLQFIKENNCMEIELSDKDFTSSIQLTRIDKRKFIVALVKEKSLVLKVC